MRDFCVELLMRVYYLKRSSSPFSNFLSWLKKWCLLIWKSRSNYNTSRLCTFRLVPCRIQINISKKYRSGNQSNVHWHISEGGGGRFESYWLRTGTLYTVNSLLLMEIQVHTVLDRRTDILMMKTNVYSYN